MNHEWHSYSENCYTSRPGFFGSLRTSNTFHFMFDGTSTVVRNTKKATLKSMPKGRKFPLKALASRHFLSRF